MADLIRALESDLFGSYEWSADLYEDLRRVPEPADRLAVLRGLFRAYDALDGRAEDAMAAAESMVELEDELPGDQSALLARLDEARDAFLETASPDSAERFLAAFEPVWVQGPRSVLVPDAILAALARSNVLASRNVGEPREHHRLSAGIYEEVATLLQKRLVAGETLWQETAASAVNRRVVALRLAGEDESAKKLAEAMGAGEHAPMPPRDRRG